MNLGLYAGANPVAILIPTTEAFCVKMIYVYLKKTKPRNQQSMKETELHVRAHLKHAQHFLSHPYFLKSSLNSKEMVVILLLHIGIYPL